MVASAFQNPGEDVGREVACICAVRLFDELHDEDGNTHSPPRQRRLTGGGRETTDPVQGVERTPGTDLEFIVENGTRDAGECRSVRMALNRVPGSYVHLIFTGERVAGSGLGKLHGDRRGVELGERGPAALK